MSSELLICEARDVATNTNTLANARSRIKAPMSYVPPTDQHRRTKAESRLRAAAEVAPIKKLLFRRPATQQVTGAWAHGVAGQWSRCDR